MKLIYFILFAVLLAGCSNGNGGMSTSTSITTTTTVPITTSTTLPGNGSIQLPRTGQNISYATNDDGAVQKGIAWPSPRLIDNNNGTVTDNLTGLVWLKNANCFRAQVWTAALASANTLASGACGLSDGSASGQWRLPNRKEMQSLLDRSKYNFALPENSFTSIMSDFYWSSSTSSYSTSSAWAISFVDGTVTMRSKNDDGVRSISNGGGFIVDPRFGNFVWPVRDGL
jgi:hypothetical protein